MEITFALAQASSRTAERDPNATGAQTTHNRITNQAQPERSMIGTMGT
jgi:hypothetical protein